MKYSHVFPYINIKGKSTTNDLKLELDRNGLVLIDVGESFSNSEFIALMKRIGEPIEETSAIDQKYVENKFVLNLKTDVSSDISMENEPFSVSGLRLHMERAFADLTRQPNYLALYCVNAAPIENGGQTIVYPMDKFHKSFNHADIELMKKLFPVSADKNIVSQNPIINYDPKRTIEYFSYRDLGKYGADWFVKNNDDSNVDAIKILADKIEKALSIRENIYALKWIPGYLYIFDNKKFFHGRTEQVSAHKRHLKRIRVV